MEREQCSLDQESNYNNSNLKIKNKNKLERLSELIFCICSPKLVQRAYWRCSKRVIFMSNPYNLFDMSGPFNLSFYQYTLQNSKYINLFSFLLVILRYVLLLNNYQSQTRALCVIILLFQLLLVNSWFFIFFQVNILTFKKYTI